MPDHDAGNDRGVPKSNKIVHLAQALRGLHDQAEVQQPDETIFTAPVVYVGKGKSRPAPQRLTLDLVEALTDKGLYMLGKDVGTVNETTGEFEIMSPKTFVTWVPMVAGVVLSAGVVSDEQTGKQKIIPGDLPVETAVVILASHELRGRLPVIESIHMVKMPVLRSELDENGNPSRTGFRKIELLPQGYDKETKTFTVRGSLDYAEDMDPDEALQWIYSILKTFPWSDMKEGGPCPWGPTSNRMAAQVAAMLTIFCRHLFRGKPPFFLHTSNLPGSGKSSLAYLCLWACYGEVGGQVYEPKDKQELRKVLDAKAQGHGVYLWFDNIPPGITLFSPILEQWATMRVWEGRDMGQNKSTFKVRTRCATFFTGNRITMGTDIGRRTVVVDLFPHQQAADRHLPADAVVLDDAFFEDDEMRSKLLASLWALVRNWDLGNRKKLAAKPKASFEGWSLIVPSIVAAAKLGNALAEFEAPGSGDDEARDMKKLCTAVIDAYCFVSRDGAIVPLDRVEVTMKDIVRCARSQQLFEERLWTVDQIMKELDSRKGYKWKLVPKVPDGFDALTMDDGKVTLVEPNEEQKKHQAAEWLDERLGASWGKFFKRMAVDEQWFPSTTGIVYEFGKRGSSKGSTFVLTKMGPKG